MFHLFEKINNNEPYIIAEMSANHGGNLEHALDIVRESKKAGADCVKVQTYTADSLTIDCNTEYFKIKDGLWEGYNLFDLYKEACMPYEWHKPIKDECERMGVDFLSTPFDRAGVDFLEELGAEAYKIASFELVDIPLIEYAATKGKPMIVSTGMGSLQEINDAIYACRNAGNNRIVLLKCCSEYPAPWEDMHLGNIPDMIKRFNVPVGLSDHSAGSIGAVVGIALGACVIEKHVKLGSIRTADSDFSMGMDDFAKMVSDVHAAKVISSGPDYSLTDGEKKQTIFRRSIFAIENIDEGDYFSEKNIRVIRPGYGISPSNYKGLIGKRATRSIKRGEPLVERDIKP